MRNNQTPSQAELQRRRQQSTRDRERNRRQQARTFWSSLERDISTLSLRLDQEATLVNALPAIAILETMPQAGPQETDPNSRFNSLFCNEKYSDTKIYLGKSNILFPAHQIVLGTCSPYFDDALQSKFKEGITKEFHFENDSPHAMWRLLQYMYTGDYTDEESDFLSSEGDDIELLKHQRVYALADMFRMEDLKVHACKKFKEQLQQHWISETFADCIREVYLMSEEKDPIRNTVVDIVSSHRELVQKRPFQELIREVGDFAVDLVLEITQVKTKDIWR